MQCEWRSFINIISRTRTTKILNQSWIWPGRRLNGWVFVSVFSLLQVELGFYSFILFDLLFKGLQVDWMHWYDHARLFWTLGMYGRRVRSRSKFERRYLRKIQPQVSLVVAKLWSTDVSAEKSLILDCRDFYEVARIEPLTSDEMKKHWKFTCDTENHQKRIQMLNDRFRLPKKSTWAQICTLSSFVALKWAKLVHIFIRFEQVSSL